MIPLRLRLTNFMSYANPPDLDLSGLHVAVLCGENGAGKSSLLDAMTWAIWGKTRARSDKDLIRQGASEMEVRFQFSLSGNCYEVRRHWQVSGKTTKSNLDLLVSAGEGWWPLTEPSIRETQAKIERLLGLNYETFVNSAFLRQGRADEFTICTPADRKKLLAEILGLSAWEEYEERTKKKCKSLEAEITRLTGQLEEIERELERRPQYERDLYDAQAMVVEVGERLLQVESAWQAIQQDQQALAHKSDLIERLSGRLAAEERQVHQLQSQLEQQRARLNDHRAILARRAEIEAGYADLQRSRAEEADLAEKAGQYVQLHERITILQGSIGRAETDLKREIQIDQEQLQQAKAKAADEHSATAELEQVQAQLILLEQKNSEREQKQAKLSNLTGQAGELRANNEALKTEMGKLRLQLDTLRAAGAVCPTCRQPLSEEARLTLIAEIECDGRSKRSHYDHNLEQQSALDQQLKALLSQMDGLDREIKKGTTLHDRAGKLKERLRQAQEAASQVETLQKRLEEHVTRYQAHEFARPFQPALDAALAEMEQLGYDDAVRASVTARVARLRGYEMQMSRLQLAAEEMPNVQEQIRTLQDSLKQCVESLSNDRAEKEQLEAQREALRARLHDARRTEDELIRLREEDRKARERMARGLQMMDVLKMHEQEKKDKLEARRKLAEEKGLHDDLRLAFGKKGVPAMIIETALPEIETTANELLTRMTNGRMHVRLEMQRESQKGDLIETLDIRIADELGTRDYAMFSGGEAFRINFALRIAISRLLAHRAGAQLQTLVVDEGFGSQDSQGRERLVDAITTIAQDFERILVVTHIDELRDAFPARIEVTKGPQGSTAVIV